MQFPHRPPDKGGGSGSGSNKWKNPKKKLQLSEFPLLTSPSGSSQQKMGKSVKTAKEVLLQEPVYYQKHLVETVIHLEEDDIPKQNSNTNLWLTMEKYLVRQPYPFLEGKYRCVCEAILAETESALIKHEKYSANDPNSAITHSKCYIIRILFPGEWGLNPYRKRTLALNNQEYNYWDYVNAWTYAFYYQNPQHKHSWFFSINPEILSETKGFPLWFLHWWDKFGPTVEVLPKELLDYFLIWYDFHPKLKGKSAANPPIGQNTLWFFTEFRITWIWRWDIQFCFDNLKIPILQRRFFCKWWPRFETARTEEIIKETVKAYKQKYDQSVAEAEAKGKSEFDPCSNIFMILSESIRLRNPSLTPEEVQVEVFKTFKEQFVSSTQKSESSSVKSQDDGHSSRFTCLAGEAQNPEDDYAEDAEMKESIEDYLDAMIEVQEEKIRKAKGKGVKSLDDL